MTSASKTEMTRNRKGNDEVEVHYYQYDDYRYEMVHLVLY